MSNDTRANNDDKVLAVGQERINLRSASSKLIADIEFLRDRINKMKQFNQPNEATLSTYEEMLRNRESVLNWLEEQQNPNASCFSQLANR